MSLINCKYHLQLNWIKTYVMSDDGDENNNNDETFKTTNLKLYLPVVTLYTEDNVKLTKQLNEEFKNWRICLFLLLTILIMITKNERENSRKYFLPE